MTNRYILGRFSHGNEPYFLALGVAAHFDSDIVMPASQSKIGLIREIAGGKGLDPKRVYIDDEAATISSAYGVIRENGMDYRQWMTNNVANWSKVEADLRAHYKSFIAANLAGEKKEFRGNKTRLVLNAGSLQDDFGLDAPIAYVFPLRYGEVTARTATAGYDGFGKFLINMEKRRAVNFIPRIHTLGYDKNYPKLDNEEFTPHMKEAPARTDLWLPDNSIGMVYSGTGRKTETLKRIAAATTHPIVTGTFAPVEGEKYTKIVPPRAEFVHVYADPRIKAVVGQTGFGMLWSAWNAGKPVVFPKHEQGDDEEFKHNAITIKKFGLGVEIKTPSQIDDAVKKAQECIPAIKAMNAELMNEFGTLDGIAYISRRIRELGLY